jgi:DMSO reductase anchor subunit
MIFTVLACLFLGGSLFLFIRNNELFAHGGRYLMHPDALVMLGVIGIPFVLVLLHIVRALQQHRRSHPHDAATHPGDG